MLNSTLLDVFRGVQRGFQLLAALQLTSYRCPQQPYVQDGASYDFIIAGGGTAGSVLANRLSELPCVSVLLIEAGGCPPLESMIPSTFLYLKNTEYEWNYTAEFNSYTQKCHRNPYADIIQGRMLGGTSSLNYYLYGRGNSGDYNGWAEEVGDQLWSWKNVLPYFIKSEKMTDPYILNSPAKIYHGTRGNLGVSVDERDEDVDDYLNAMKELGIKVVLDVNEDQPKGYAKMLFTIADGVRQSTATSYLYPVKQRRNLHVLKYTTVVKVIIDKNKRAVGVEAITDDGKKITIKANKEVILSAGALNTPKLLMLSGIGPKKHLMEKNVRVVVDSPSVGQNLQDHVGVSLIYNFNIVPKDRSNIDSRRNPASAVVGYDALKKTQRYPDYETMNFFVDAGDDLSTLFCLVALGVNDEICASIRKSSLGKRAIFNQVINFKTKSRGEIRLRSLNPLDPPEIYTNYLSNNADLENLVDYVMHFSRSFNTTFYSKRSIKPEEFKLKSCGGLKWGSRDYWKCYVSCMMTGMSYFGGTARFGADSRSVVDVGLRVRGVTGLRVVDASVIPVLPSGNIYAPVVMIAEKAADIIKEDHDLYESVMGLFENYWDVLSKLYST